VANFDLDFNVSTIALPSDRPTYKFTGGATVSASQTIGFPIRTQTLWFNLRNLPSFDSDQILDFIDTVNSSTFKGGAAGHVLFEGARTRGRIMQLGSPTYEEGLAFTWRNFKWNQLLNPATGTFQDIETIVGGNPPHAERNHNLLIGGT
jgi:hypothetical protein